MDALRLDAAGSVLITDFGYSGAKLTGSGEMADLKNPAASPAYTPPEVLLGHSIVNASYDGEVLGAPPLLPRRCRCCNAPRSECPALRSEAANK